LGVATSQVWTGCISLPETLAGITCGVLVSPTMSLVTSAIDHIGLRPIADRYGFRLSAVHKWKTQGRLPRTELAGLTDYAKALEELSEGKFRASDLIAETRVAWQRLTAKAVQAKRSRQKKLASEARAS
jgi:hypothetical protein